MRLHRILDRIFPEHEEMNGRGRCPTFLYRWTIFRAPNWQIYLHNFVANDWTIDQHDHPKRFISIGLWGGYTEETPTGPARYQAPWIRTFPATHRHRVTHVGRGCWTVAITLKTVREWGFYHDGEFIHFRAYTGKNSQWADQSRDCL